LGIELALIRGRTAAAYMETVFKSAHLRPRVRWILQLASAVVHLHRHRIAHHNLLLQTCLLDDNLSLKLAGLSHAFICDTSMGFIYNPKNELDPTKDQTETIQTNIYDFRVASLRDRELERALHPSRGALVKSPAPPWD